MVGQASYEFDGSRSDLRPVAPPWYRQLWLIRSTLIVTLAPIVFLPAPLLMENKGVSFNYNLELFFGGGGGWSEEAMVFFDDLGHWLTEITGDKRVSLFSSFSESFSYVSTFEFCPFS